MHVLSVMITILLDIKLVRVSLSRYDAETLLDNYNILISSARPCQYVHQPTSREQRTNRRTDGAQWPGPSALSDRSYGVDGQ